MQKIRTTGVSFKIGYIGSLKWVKIFYKRLFLGCIFIYVQIKHLYTIPYMKMKNGGKF
jgi:hypothetical protein